MGLQGGSTILKKNTVGAPEKFPPSLKKDGWDPREGFIRKKSSWDQRQSFRFFKIKAVTAPEKISVFLKENTVGTLTNKISHSLKKIVAITRECFTLKKDN